MSLRYRVSPRAAFALVLIVVAAACSRKTETPSTNLNVANKVSMRSVRLYYEAPTMLLGAEPRSLPLPESSGAAIPMVVRELMKGPVQPAMGRLFPEDTVVRSAFLLPGGTVIVDLGGATLTQGWGTGSHQELMALYSLSQTLHANFPEALRVRVLINGTPSETLAGHISLQKSLAPPAVELIEASAR